MAGFSEAAYTLQRGVRALELNICPCPGQVGAVTGSKILRIMKGLGLAPEIPEDLYHLIKKAVSMRKHLELFRKDRDGKFRLILVESRIHRLARYYKVRRGEPTCARKLGVGCAARPLCVVTLVESRIHRLARYYKVRSRAPVIARAGVRLGASHAYSLRAHAQHAAVSALLSAWLHCFALGSRCL